MPDASALTPKIELIPNGNYFPVQMDRPGYLIAIDSATAGTIYTYPVGTPTSDAQAIPWTNGYAYLGGKGRWYVKHSAGSSQNFRVIYDGSAGDSASVLPSAAELFNLQKINGTTQTALDLTKRFSPLTLTTQGGGTVGTSSAQALAANANRRFLNIKNTHATQTLSYKFGSAAVAGEAFVLAAGGEHSWDAAVAAVPTGALNVIGSAPGTTYAIAEGE